MSVDRFIRFEDEKGNILYGEPAASDLSGDLEGKSVSVLTGDPFAGLSSTDRTSIVKKLLCPLESTPIVIGIGLNYAHHAKESNLSIPSYPVVFTKPPDALAGPYDTISIHPDAQSQLDYEGELTVVIGHDAKNVKESEALDYVLGYTAGNDISARNFQLPASVSGNQFSYAKSFDRFAPIGPSVLLGKGVDPHKLKYVTRVNDEKRQETGTDDMIWSVAKLVEHLSRGTTLRRGTVIMTDRKSVV